MLAVINQKAIYNLAAESKIAWHVACKRKKQDKI